MLNASEDARKFWPAQYTDKTEYGEDAASDFAVLAGVRHAVLSAFDKLALDAADIGAAQEVTHAFTVVWNLINEKHNETLNEVEQRKSL